MKIYKKEINKPCVNHLIKHAHDHNVNIIEPIDEMIIKVLKNNVCIYEYVEGKVNKKLTNEQIEKVIDYINLDKPVNFKASTMLDKVNFYHDSLFEMETRKIHRTIIDELLKKYRRLQNYKIFEEKQIVHGDICPSNLIWQDKEFILLDLDEATIFTKLYDLIVFAIKSSKNDNEIDAKIAKKILKPNEKYSKVDIINVWNFYLIKVILEKIYLYETDKIDLRDDNQIQDKFEDWLEILNSSIIEEILNK